MDDQALGEIDRLASQSLGLWDLSPGARAVRINVSENVTYLVQDAKDRVVLRVHRPGYHSYRAIECELAWSTALRVGDVVRTPALRLGRNRQPIQTVEAPDGPRHLVMFEFVPGHQPDENDDLVPGFAELGAMAARTHLHSLTWERPQPFERLVWNIQAVFGPHATWGDWRAAPNVTAEVRSVLEQVETTVCNRLDQFGHGADRFGLIHADMRLANLLIGPDGTYLIDFDDCGFGWHLYDFAAGVSFFEDHPQVPALRAAWVAGYRTVRDLSAVEEAEIDTFIMLRRMALLAWIGTHIQAPEPQALAPDSRGFRPSWGPNT